MAAVSGALTGADDGVAVAASALAGLTVAASAAAGLTVSGDGLTVVAGAAEAWVAESFLGWVDGRVE